MLARLAPAAPILLFVVLALSSAGRESIAFDELAHIAGGHHAWSTGGHNLHTQNGALTQRWLSLPLLAARPRYAPGPGTVWDAGRRLFFESGNDVERLRLLARVQALAVGVLLLLAVYAWSKKLFGATGGLISLTAAALDPNLLAHGRIATSDAAAAAWFLLATRYWWELLHRPSRKALVLSAATAAALFTSKMSGVFFLPTAAVLLALRWRTSPRPAIPAFQLARGAAAFSAIVLILMWGAYGFRSGPAPGTAYSKSWTRVVADAGNAGVFIAAVRKSHLLPDAFLHGLASVSGEAKKRGAFLNGEVSDTGWARYFPAVFLMKTPLPLLALLLLAAFLLLRGRASPYELAPLLAIIGVFGLTLLSSSINIGLRHMLPLYPPLFVLAGVTARAPRRLAGACLLFALSVAVWTWPHYLSFFNAPSGGPANGYNRLVDSSLDWGQDLPSLAAFLEKEPESAPVYLAYFGSDSPKRYGIRARRLPAYIDMDREPYLDALTAGTYCVSATLLQSVYTPVKGRWSGVHEAQYQRVKNARTPLAAHWRFERVAAFLRKRRPDARVAHSILVYRLSESEIRLALDGPPPFPENAS